MITRIDKLFDQIYDLLKNSKWWFWSQNSQFLLNLVKYPEARIGIAEGDSWFDYRFTSKFIHGTGEDLIGHLCKDGDLNIFRLSIAGDTLEDMAGEPQMTNFRKVFEVMDQSVFAKPAFIMFSAGGNDMAGEEGVHLKTFLTENGLDQAKYRQKLGQMMDQYRSMIGNARAVGPQIPVFLHGYAYPVPDGRGVFDIQVDNPELSREIPGPWLKPAFDGTQISASDQQMIVSDLIDQFNEALETLANELDNVHYINLRNCLPKPPYANYRKDWANELHPTSDGFRKIAATMKKAILENS